MKPFFFCSVLLTDILHIVLNHYFQFSDLHIKINDAQPWQQFVFILFVWWSFCLQFQKAERFD